jgi:hypothetical protein
MFTEADLEYFEMVSEPSQRPMMQPYVQRHVLATAIGVTVYRSGTLSWDRTGWHV